MNCFCYGEISFLFFQSILTFLDIPKDEGLKKVSVRIAHGIFQCVVGCDGELYDNLRKRDERHTE